MSETRLVIDVAYGDTPGEIAPDCRGRSWGWVMSEEIESMASDLLSDLSALEWPDTTCAVIDRLNRAFDLGASSQREASRAGMSGTTRISAEALRDGLRLTEYRQETLERWRAGMRGPQSYDLRCASVAASERLSEWADEYAGAALVELVALRAAAAGAGVTAGEVPNDGD